MENIGLTILGAIALCLGIICIIGLMLDDKKTKRQKLQAQQRCTKSESKENSNTTHAEQPTLEGMGIKLMIVFGIGLALLICIMAAGLVAGG